MSTAREPADSFIGELKRWRDVRGLSQTRLAKRVGYTPSYVSKVESGALPGPRMIRRYTVAIGLNGGSRPNRNSKRAQRQT